MSESKTTWEEKAKILCDFYKDNSYEPPYQGYLKILDEFKEALKKEMMNVICIPEDTDYKDGFENALSFALNLIDTVQPRNDSKRTD